MRGWGGCRAYGPVCPGGLLLSFCPLDEGRSVCGVSRMPAACPAWVMWVTSEGVAVSVMIPEGAWTFLTVQQIFLLLAGTFSVAAPSIVMDNHEKIKARNPGNHPLILGGLAYLTNRFVLVLTKEVFNAFDFLISRHTYIRPPHLAEVFCEC